MVQWPIQKKHLVRGAAPETGVALEHVADLGAYLLKRSQVSRVQ